MRPPPTIRRTLRLNMADHIPFVTSTEGVKLVNRHYADSEIVRVPLDRAVSLIAELRTGTRVWVDPCVDGMDNLEMRRGQPERETSWFAFMSAFPKFEVVGHADYHKRPLRSDVAAFVAQILDVCAKHNPAWITVPQIPVVSGPTRNKINRLLAEETGNWKTNSGFSGRLILPVVVTNQKQITGKTARNPKVEQAVRCYNSAHADGFWVVDTSLVDDNGSPTLRSKRFPAIISLHEELNERISSAIRIAGPYWALNLALWARGIVDYPAIGVGSGYQYHLAGGIATTPSARIALPSLRRRVGVDPSLRVWLDAAVAKLGPSHPARSEFSRLRNALELVSQVDQARLQVTKFYKRWFEILATTTKEGRSLALFQDLSAAYTLGKSLPDLANEGTARRPEAIAETLLFSCL
jgi:hypothetical protein